MLVEKRLTKKKLIINFNQAVAETTPTERKGHSVCNICEKTFTRTCQLNQHIKSIHEGKTSHACTVCYKTFAQSSYLKYHIKNVLQFVANLIRSSDLKHHIKTLHTGEKSHMCTFCNKSFTKSCRPASRTM